MGCTGTTVVVGGGCSGVIAAVHLLRHSPDRVVMLEPSTSLGTGIAYRTPDAVHLLNTRAGVMSAEDEAPGHFAEWVRRRPVRVGPEGFARRGEYGRYLTEVMDATASGHPGRFTHIRSRVTALRLSARAPGRGRRAPAGLDQARICVVTDAVGVLHADRVVLAIGHGAPDDPPVIDAQIARHPRYIADPWRPAALDAVPLDAPVLLIGTGLTAVDVALSLTARGLRAPVHAVSRHGLVPRTHERRPAPPADVDLPPPDSLRALVRSVRSLATLAGPAQGDWQGDWRTVVDGLRPHTNALWRALPVEERLRFLRHVARYWEVHRHRMAPAITIAVRGLIADGALRVHAASLATVADDSGSLVVSARSGSRWRVGTVINCTGLGSAIRTPLGRALVADGFARLDPLGIGFDVDGHGRLVSARGGADDRLVVIGPARRGQWWETTAVPEIRAQAWALATGDAMSSGSGARGLGRVTV